jgi:hypothetical protein
MLRDKNSVTIDCVAPPITDRTKDFGHNVSRNVFQNNDRPIFSNCIDAAQQSVFFVAFRIQLNDSNICARWQNFVDRYNVYRNYIALYTLVISIPSEDM